MRPFKTITFVTNYEDWEGLYIDGVCVDQDHKLKLLDVLSILGIPVQRKDVDLDWLYERGTLPENESELKLADDQ